MFHSPSQISSEKYTHFLSLLLKQQVFDLIKTILFDQQMHFVLLSTILTVTRQ